MFLLTPIVIKKKKFFREKKKCHIWKINAYSTILKLFQIFIVADKVDKNNRDVFFLFYFINFEESENKV